MNLGNTEESFRFSNEDVATAISEIKPFRFSDEDVASAISEIKPFRFSDEDVSTAISQIKLDTAPVPDEIQ